MLVVPVAAFMPKAAGGVITTVYGPVSMNTNSSGWDGYTLACEMRVGLLSAASGAPKMRCTIAFTGFSSTETCIGYIGQAAADHISFTGDQVQLKWGGNTAITGDGATLTYLSDFATLAQNFNNTADYVAAFYFAGGLAVNVVRNTVSPNANAPVYYKAGNDAATTTKTGYTVSSGSPQMFLTQLDVST